MKFILLTSILIKLISCATEDETCYRVKCDKLPNRCSEKSDLEFNIILSDQCGKIDRA
jgi:hypothetical protein